MNIVAYSFLAELEQKISYVSGDVRESSYLFQRISVLIQHYNAFLRQCLQFRRTYSLEQTTYWYPGFQHSTYIQTPS